MSGVSFTEFFIILAIALVVLGPERLPKVANQIGKVFGQARRMTRNLRRQLEDEVNISADIENVSNELQREFDIGGMLEPPPRDDDDFSPMHDPEDTLAGDPAESLEPPAIDIEEPGDADEEPEQEAASQEQESDDEQRRQA